MTTNRCSFIFDANYTCSKATDETYNSKHHANGLTYAPTSDYSEDDKEAFCSDVQTTVIPPREALVTMGYFHAGENDLNTSCLSKYGVGERYSNGEHLIGLCEL